MIIPRLLLDTHALIWLCEGGRLPAKVREIVSAGNSTVLVSMASLWEIGIKCSSGKLRVDGGVEGLADEFLSYPGTRLLPVEISHINRLARLHFHHRDPFDRMIIAQAFVEYLAVVSTDEAFDLYGVPRIWDI